MPGETIDLAKLLGASCTLVISHQQNMVGKTYASIDAVSKPTKKVAASGTYDPVEARKRFAEWKARQASATQANGGQKPAVGGAHRTRTAGHRGGSATGDRADQKRRPRDANRSARSRLLAARALIGDGVAACLMAPLTCYRRLFSPVAQLRANSWMLMTGSLGMLASTLPTQWLLPVVGWRGLFVVVAGLLVVAGALLLAVVPRDRVSPGTETQDAGGYAQVFRAPAFRRFAPSGFFCYGGLIAMQSLWIGPWLTEVGGRTPDEAAAGLFAVNASMLVAFLGWGVALPRLIRLGWNAERLIGFGWPLGVGCLALLIWRGAQAGALEWAAWCVQTALCG